MFSYRHAYHAGNHADVLKHFIQVQLHHYMNQKDTAYTYIDTHSGAGVYALDSAQAIKSGEYIDGIGRLWGRDDLPPALAEYVELISTLNPSGKLRYYPGSPWVADAMARSQDRLRLFELHRADTKLLMENIRKLEAHKAEQGEHARGRRILADFSDGFLGLKALLPPPSRRALVLIDPPYEVKLDYKHVRDALEDALGRFPGGVYSVWYPVLQRMESRQFPDRLKRLPAKEWLHVTLSVAGPRADGKGLHSSAMFILNPPYTLEPMLRQVLPYLVQVLGQDSGASFHIERGTQQTGAVSRGGLVEAGQRTGTTGTPRQPIGNARRASPLSGAGSLRLPGQPFGDGPRARAGAADAAKPQGDAAKGDGVRSSRPGTPRAPAATGTTMRPGTPARAGGGPDARPDARPTTGAGPRATGAGRTQPMSARGVNTAGGDRPANTSRSASARSSGRTAPGGIKRGGPAKS